jgi:hypothetical protein
MINASVAPALSASIANSNMALYKYDYYYVFFFATWYFIPTGIKTYERENHNLWECLSWLRRSSTSMLPNELVKQKALKRWIATERRR